MDSDVVDIADVMRRAVSKFAPNGANLEQAVASAVQAGQRYQVALFGSVENVSDPEELRSAAIGVWTLYCEQSMEESFEVTSVSRKDLMSIGATEAQARLLSDEDMRTIARRMGDDHVIDGDFWMSLGIVASRTFEEKHQLQINFSDTPHDE